jgi:uncharacterized coiled-coil DUF342 family protein
VFDSEKERIQDSRSREERELSRRQRNLTELIAELSMEREQLQVETKELVEASGVYDEEIAELRREIDVYILYHFVLTF